jgi:hypothetical protein
VIRHEASDCKDKFRQNGEQNGGNQNIFQGNSNQGAYYTYFFEMIYEEAVSYFIRLENLERICGTNETASVLGVDNKIL